ncbi:brefeldin A-inhibited guanine nucleotide-exchange protein 3-like isoform X3 [Salvelinus sp. IW2-2015]|uniref:brefeldin A-inhibited guanine nucleotide-exchange protein 3-like isoform X3 n=1 Tax=Salvelinus sp. IW2-2015 TaxID=2691554 RepID=UPI000CDFD0D6|nr:brefeldin A-inhibited guanine nucleotide-exchange protein 3-like isoform X3 [Salvelinus alpinus]
MNIIVHSQTRLKTSAGGLTLQTSLAWLIIWTALNGDRDSPKGRSGERCLRPLQLALESKNRKLAQTALTGMQKMLSEDRFVSLETEALERQLLSQMLDAVRVTPMLHEDLQVEVMKVRPFCTYGLLKRSLL